MAILKEGVDSFSYLLLISVILFSNQDHPCVYDFCFFYNTAEVVCVFLLNRIKENAFLMYVEIYFIILKQ
jgi:hypothetical protein